MTEDTGCTRKLRARKERKLYSDDWALGEDEDMDETNINVFSIADKIDAPRFNQNFVKEMSGIEFNMMYLQQHGFNTPILFREKVGLGLQVPSSTFSIDDVRMCVGSRRVLDVMDVATQKNFEMTMKEWQKYYEEPKKDRLLNVISLEFSHTRLENYVRRPNIVRVIDWVDCAWPRQLKDAQRESTNALDEMMYPKVQKYCLMSVKGCYTDFHIDFGGTSVWYHILKGIKVFWLIPPTEHNMQLYEQWILSGKQSDIFFGDTVEKCGRVILVEGNTFFIPTGWIHAVYTLKDSLVFGGNFLHSFGVEKQLRVAQVEETTHVPNKFRYPYFTEMLWYVLERYVYVLLGNSHLKDRNVDNRENGKVFDNRVHLTPQELHGLKAIVKYLLSLASNKRNIPDLIIDPVPLIKDVRTLIELHCQDTPELAITGRPVLPPQEKPRKYVPKTEDDDKSKIPKIGKGSNGANNLPRRRRTRCKTCQACKQSDCGECPFCQDMVKFGGPGRAKQTCVMRQCLQPMLPLTATCMICGLDGWGQQILNTLPKVNQRDTPNKLMECSICYDIVHRHCILKSVQSLSSTAKGVDNEDLPNSWECPRCCKDGRNVLYKPRHFRARHKSSVDLTYRNDEDSEYSDVDSSDTRPGSVISLPSVSSFKRRKMDELVKSHSVTRWSDETATRTDESSRAAHPAPVLSAEPRKLALRVQLANQLTMNSSKSLRRPPFAVRPPPSAPRLLSADSGLPPYMNRVSLTLVFHQLTAAELARCALVCKSWANVAAEPVLWRRIDITNKRLTASCLIGIARRQPETLIADWTAIARRQLEWLVARLPQLRELSLQGCSWTGVIALRTISCPPLTALDLSFVTGLNDAALRDILSPPKDTRPGLVDTKSRLRNLRTLRLAGCDISDVSLRYVVQNLPLLRALDVSQCFRLTDAAIAQLTATTTTRTTLTWLDLSGLATITNASLDHLTRCEALLHLDLRHTTQITNAAVQQFALIKGFDVIDDKLLTKAETRDIEMEEA